MNYFRELVALYPGKDPLTQKFVLAQLTDAEPELDSHEIAALLWNELAAAETVVRRQARYALGAYLPRHAAHGFGVPAPDPDTAPRLFAGALGPALAAALTRAERAGAATEERALAWVAAGTVRTESHEESLRAKVAAATSDLDAALALACLGGEAAGAVLRDAVRRAGQRRPDLYLALRGYTDADTLALLTEQESAASGYGRVNVALALAFHEPEARRDLMACLVTRNEGWVTAAVMDSLACLSAEGDLALVRRAYDLERHEFVRFQIVRAAGTIETLESREFCLARLADGAPRVRSAALEALSRQSVDAALAQEVAPHLESEFLRSRVHAALIVGRHDPERAAAAVEQLVLSEEPILRLEAAYVLGHLQGPASLPLLTRMALEDESAAVRAQAVMSLAGFPALDTVEPLVRVVESPDAATARVALRALTRAGPLPAQALSDAARAVGQRAALLPDLCTLLACADRLIPALALEALDAGDPVRVTAALEGLKRFGDQLPRERIAPLAAHADARIAARAAACQVLAGDGAGADRLAALAWAEDEAASRESLTAVVELAVLAPALAGRARFAAFGRLFAAPASNVGAQNMTRRTRGTRKLAAPVAPVQVKPAAPAPEPSMVRLYRPTGVHRKLSLAAAMPAAGELAAPTGWANRSSMSTPVLRPPPAVSPLRRIVPVLALAIAAVAYAVNRPPAPVAEATSPGKPGTMRVVTCQSPCTASAPRKGQADLFAGDRVRPGSVLWTGIGGSLELADPSGNAIRLGPDSTLTLGQAEGARYAVSDARGTCTLDLRREKVARLALPAGPLMLENALVELTPAKSTLKEGAGRLGDRRLGAGDALP